MKISRHHIYISLFCLYMLAVGYLCFSRPDEIPSIPLDWFGIPTEKIAHFVMFTPFPILASLAFIPEKYGKFRKVLGIIAIAALGAVTAAATEQIQEVLGYRCYETKDMMADLIGIAAGAVAMMAYVALKTEQK